MTAEVTRTRSLDGFRGVAILAVLSYDGFASYFRADSGTPWAFAVLDRIGEMMWIGVTLFFVLSGYLIGATLLSHRSAVNYYSVFFLRRVCRIVPLYLVLIAPLLILPVLIDHPRFGALAQHATLNAPSPACHLLFLQNFTMAYGGEFGPRWLATTWSLAVEMQFYVLAAILVRHLPARLLAPLLIGMVLTAPLFRLILTFALPGHHAGIASYVLLPCRWDALAIGMLLAVPPTERASAKTDFLSWLDRPVVALSVIAATFTLLAFAHDPISPIASTFGHSAAALAALAFLSRALKPGRLQRILTSPFLTGAGAISYALYLMHEPILSFGIRVVFGESREIVSLRSTGYTVAGLAITAVVATVSWFAFEKPILLWAHRWKYRMIPSPAGISVEPARVTGR